MLLAYNRLIPGLSGWSTGGSLIVARSCGAGTGTQNAGLAAGGYGPPGAVYQCTEEYDGTSWTAGGAMIGLMCANAAAGTQNAGLTFAGRNPSKQCSEEYDGTSWTAGTPHYRLLALHLVLRLLLWLVLKNMTEHPGQ